MSLDALRKSSSLIIGWDHRNFKLLNSWSIASRIGVHLECCELNLPQLFLNIYGDYVERESYWNSLFAKSLLTGRNSIIGGGLKISLGQSEI